jgi:hypothetical protein
MIVIFTGEFGEHVVFTAELLRPFLRFSSNVDGPLQVVEGFCSQPRKLAGNTAALCVNSVNECLRQ